MAIAPYKYSYLLTYFSYFDDLIFAVLW